MLLEQKIQDTLAKGERIGIEKGGMIRLITMVTKKLSKGKSIDVIADELEEDISVIEAICKVVETFGSDYDPSEIYEALKK